MRNFVATAITRPQFMRVFVWGAFALVLIVAPWIFHQGRALSILSQMGTLMIFGLSFNMLLGQGGMLSLGHSVYSGLGTFFAIHAMRMMDEGALLFPMTFLPLVGGLAGMFFGILFGYLITKKSGITFAMITLGMVELVFAGALMFPDFFGGEGGITANRVTGQPFMNIRGLTYGPNIQVYYLIAFWLFICTAAMFALSKTPLGRMANAVRDNPERVEFIGYDARMVRYLIFILSAFFAGISGALSAIQFEMVTAESIGAFRSGGILLFTLIGGIGFFWGPMIGVLVGVLMSALLADVTKAWQLYLALFFIFIVMFSPGGIAHFLAQHYRVAAYAKYRRIGMSMLALSLAVLLAMAGAVMMIEMIYHLRLDAENGPSMMLFGMIVDATHPASWVSALFMLGIGALAYKFSKPIFAFKWNTVNAEIESQIREAKI